MCDNCALSSEVKEVDVSGTSLHSLVVFLIYIPLQLVWNQLENFHLLPKHFQLILFQGLTVHWQFLNNYQLYVNNIIMIFRCHDFRRPV